MCPKCKKGSVSVKPILTAKVLGSYSISGVQDKIVAKEKWLASCSSCDFSVIGFLEDPEVGPDGVFTGGYFVAEESNV